MNHKLMAGVIALTLSIILIGSTLIPVIQNVQTTAGDEITKTNSGNELLVTDDLSETHTFGVTSPNEYVTIDGNNINIADSKTGFYIISDGCSVMFTGSYAIIDWDNTTFQYLPVWGNSYSITWSNGTVTLVRTTGGTSTTYSNDYTWIGTLVDSGGNYVNRVAEFSTTYTYDGNDILAMGNYTSGDNDTFYLIKDGTLTLSESQYVGSFGIKNKTLADGTTDLYTGSLEITVGDETFVPYIWVVAKEVTGHEASGAAYSLYGLIPLLIICAIVIMAAGMIYNRRDY